MAKTKAFALSNKSKGQAYLSGCGYKGVRRQGSKYGWKYEDGKISRSKGGFDTPEEAAYYYDEFLLHYIGPNADTNQALGFLKLKYVLEIREKVRKDEKPMNKARRSVGCKIGKSGYKGVSPQKNKSNPFKAQTVINNKYVQIGNYPTAEAAARAYDAFVLAHNGYSAVTNVSLGLLPEVDEVPFIKPEKLQPMPAPVIEDDPDDEEIIPVPQYRTPEEEREAQRLAALAMSDEEEEEPEPEPAPLPEAPTPPAPPVQEAKTEILVMTDADKLRARAEAMLREAAEI